MGVGTIRCVLIDVTDLSRPYEFWGAVTELELIGSETGWHDWLGFGGAPAAGGHFPTRNPGI